MRLRHYIFILLSITFLVYFSSFWNYFVWDDEQFIYENRYVLNFDIKKIFSESTTSGAGIKSDYYRPLTTLSFAIDTNLWGLRPFPFHLINTFLHATSGSLIFLILLGIGLSRKQSFWIALIFLLHPLQTEAVTYINSRGDSLYTFFGMLSVLSFIAALHKKNYTWKLYNLQFKSTRLLFISITLVCYLLAILSKEIALATLGIHFLVFLKYSFDNRHLEIRKILHKYRAAMLTLLASIVMAGTYILLRATILNFSNTFNLYDDGSLYSESVVVRLLTFTKVIWIYFKIIILPYPLHMERTTELVTSIISPWPILTLLLFSVLLYLGYREYTVYKQLYIYFGSAWFFGMLIPVSGIVPINGILYEHWLYLPLVGFCIVCSHLYMLLIRDTMRQILHEHIQIFLYALVLLYCILTVRQNYFWSTPIRLFEHLSQFAASARIYTNLGMAYANAGELEKAIISYEKSLQLSDQYPQTFHNLANTYRDTNNTTQAIENYKLALAVQPDFYFSYKPLLDLLIIEKRFDEAAVLVAQMQTHFPNDPTYVLFEIIYLVEADKIAEAKVVLNELKIKFPAEQKYSAFAKDIIAEAETKNRDPVK